MDGFLTFLLAVAAWLALILILHRRWGDRFSLFGPALMLKTARGRNFIKRVGRWAFWKHYGNLAVFITVLGVFFTLSFLLWEATIVMSIPASRAPSPQEAIGIPGINPVIPLWYGLAGLIVAVVLHELAHGLLSAHGGIEVKSLGVLLFIIPIGAFVEPDEESLMKGDRARRMRVFAAGPFTNLLVALLSLLLLTSMAGSIEPVSEGALVTSSIPQSGIPAGALITAVGNHTVRDVGDLWDISLPPGEPVEVRYHLDGWNVAEVRWGLYVVSLVEGYPAESAGVEVGDIVVEVNGTEVRNYTDFTDALDMTRAGQEIPVALLREGEDGWYRLNITVKLADKYEYYLSYGVADGSLRGKGFMGVSVSILGLRGIDVALLKEVYSNPLNGGFQGALTFISLPFLGLSPVEGGFQNAYITPISPPVFWVLFNLLYWIFWINLMLGLTNALPAIPLDGGYVFRDFITALMERLKVSDAETKAVAITRLASISVLFLILWQFIGPRLV